MGGEFPSSSVKKVQKGKEKMTKIGIQQQEEDLHETEWDFDLVDLREHDDNESKSIVIKENDALIWDFQVNLHRAEYII